jgi:hypothetical protein
MPVSEEPTWISTGRPCGEAGTVSGPRTLKNPPREAAGGYGEDGIRDAGLSSATPIFRLPEAGGGPPALAKLVSAASRSIDGARARSESFVVWEEMYQRIGSAALILANRLSGSINCPASQQTESSVLTEKQMGHEDMSRRQAHEVAGTVARDPS